MFYNIFSNLDFKKLICIFIDIFSVFLRAKKYAVKHIFKFGDCKNFCYTCEESLFLTGSSNQLTFPPH